MSFGYEKDQQILHHINLEILPGKRYAPVGASGSGKSTLLNLLMGGYGGYEGSVTLDSRTCEQGTFRTLVSQGFRWGGYFKNSPYNLLSRFQI